MRHIKTYPFLILLSALYSCSVRPPLDRVKLSQPNITNNKDTTIVSMKEHIKWVDDKGVTRIVTKGERDSITGEDITTVELSEVTVIAKSKNTAERNGKINLDFIVTVPGSLINKKWQVQLTPTAYKNDDTITFDKILLSGADFAKIQKKGMLQYQAFVNSIIPDSLYLKEMFDTKGYNKAIQELEEEYYTAWKNEVIQKEKWIDWSDKMNNRFQYFNTKVEKNKQFISTYNTVLKILPEYWMNRKIEKRYIPEKWKIFSEGHKIKTKSISKEDSAIISKRFYDYKKIAENQRKREMVDEMYDKFVKFPYQKARLDTIIQSGKNLSYYYRQEIPATENTKKIYLTLQAIILDKDENITQLPPSDTLTYYVSSMVQFLDRTPKYKKRIISRKDEFDITAYVNYKTGSTEFDERLGNNKTEIEKVYETIKNINYTGQFLIDSIYMTATSSPEGNYYTNMALSKSRAINIKKYLLNNSDDKVGVDSLFRPKWKGEDWSKLYSLINNDDSLTNKKDIMDAFNIENLDIRENSIKKFASDYSRIREKYYPKLRAVEFKFHLHRRGMIQDTIVMPVLDSTYLKAVKMIENRQYKKALVILDEFYKNDYNTAICLMSLGYDKRAMDIMLQQKDTSDRNYILAILFARLKDETQAVKYFIRSCEQDEAKIWRGRLDPEINILIKTYNLYKDEY